VFTYYKIVSLCCLLLVISAVVFVGMYVSSMLGMDILFNSYQLNEAFVPLIVSLAIGFFLRWKIKARLIIDVLRHGRHAIATILEAKKIESVYSSPSPGDGFDDIYRLRLRVDTGGQEWGMFVTSVVQPFHPRAKSLLVPGNTVPVNYTPKIGLTIVMSPESVPWLANKSFPIFRPLIALAN
jgi:hypothetical protein